jgi:hypothetical protein
MKECWCHDGFVGINLIVGERWYRFAAAGSVDDFFVPAHVE